MAYVGPISRGEPMESFDQSVKYLLQREPADFLRFGLDAPTLTVVEPLPTNLPSPGRDVDGAAQRRFRGTLRGCAGTSSG